MKVEYSVLDDLVFRKFKRLNLEILMHYITLQICIFWGGNDDPKGDSDADREDTITLYL